MFFVFLENFLPTAFAQFFDAGANPLVFKPSPFLVTLLRKFLAILLQVGGAFGFGYSGLGLVEFLEVLVWNGMLRGLSVTIEVRYTRETHPASLAVVKRLGLFPLDFVQS